MWRTLTSLPVTPASSWEDAAEAALHRRRVRRMLFVGGTALVLVSLFWGTHFALHGHWLVFASDVLMLVFGITTLWLNWRHRTLTAALALWPACLLILVVQALWLDVPTVAAPRSVHLFFLPLAVLGMVVFRNERPWLSRGAPGLCLGLFLVFASTQAGFMTAYQLSDELRTWGTAINAVFAVTILYVALYVLQTDASPSTARTIELQRALRHGEMVLHFQPQVSVAGQVEGAEALVRWQHPSRGLMMPGTFIPLAEQSGLIVPLGQWVLEQACQLLAQWARDPSLAPLTLAVNVSARQLLQPGFVSEVLEALERAGVPAQRLRLELTESVLVQDMSLAVSRIAELQAHGVGCSLDDFGTGFSSLSYLKRLPLSELKIDKSFVDDLPGSESDAAIVRSILALGQSLGLKVIAEGVETAAQLAYLHQLGCPLFQGYWFSRPLPQEAFEAYVRQPASERALTQPGYDAGL